MNNTEITSNKYNEIIKEMVNSKLTNKQLSEGWLFTKEVQYILGCSERTLARWRELRKKGNKTVGIPCILENGKYKYAIESIYQYYWNSAIA